MTTYKKPDTDIIINVLDVRSAKGFDQDGRYYIEFIMNDDTTMEWDFPSEHERDRELQIIFDLQIATRKL